MPAHQTDPINRRAIKTIVLLLLINYQTIACVPMRLFGVGGHGTGMGPATLTQCSSCDSPGARKEQGHFPSDRLVDLCIGVVMNCLKPFRKPRH